MDWPFKELKSGAKDVLKYQVSQNSEIEQADLNKSRNSETEKLYICIYLSKSYSILEARMCNVAIAAS